MKNDTVSGLLSAWKEESFAAFQRRLLPTMAAEKVLGVRTPALRRLARQLKGTEEAELFLQSLPHDAFEENNLHAFLLEDIRDFDQALARVEAFLPYVDNWATCDQLSPKSFAREPERLLPAIERWIRSEHVYTVRFGIGMLMRHFLDERFDQAYPALVAEIRSEEYYVNMMIAWYFATALAKQYDAVLTYIEERRLDNWTHNKAIQKALESFRVTAEQKTYLRTLKF